MKIHFEPQMNTDKKNLHHSGRCRHESWRMRCDGYGAGFQQHFWMSHIRMVSGLLQEYAEERRLNIIDSISGWIGTRRCETCVTG